MSSSIFIHHTVEENLTLQIVKYTGIVKGKKVDKDSLFDIQKRNCTICITELRVIKTAFLYFLQTRDIKRFKIFFLNSFSNSRKQSILKYVHVFMQNSTYAKP